MCSWKGEELGERWNREGGRVRGEAEERRGRVRVKAREGGVREKAEEEMGRVRGEAEES